MGYNHTDLGCILISPKWPGSGEWGRGSVGEVLVRMRLFRLLVRQLPEKESGCQQRPQTFECEPMRPLFHFRSSLLFQAAASMCHIQGGVCLVQLSLVTLNVYVSLSPPVTFACVIQPMRSTLIDTGVSCMLSV